jgi:hypothetical protein
VDSLWDEETGENLSLTHLQSQIQAKTEAFISVTQKGGLFDQLVTETNQKMEDAQRSLRALESKREYIKATLYDLAIKSIDGYLTFSDGISDHYLKPKMGQRRSIKQDAVLRHELMSFTIPKLTAREYDLINQALIHLEEDNMDMKGEIFETITKCNDAKSSVNVTDLPEDHPAIETKLTPSYSIVKNKPKVTK